MLIFPNIDPIAINIGPVSIHWYGIMYLLAFVCGGALGVYRAKSNVSDWSRSQVWDLVFYVAIGAVLGGRIGYAVFYNFDYYFNNPIDIIRVWSGGMSFHGGLIGVIVSVYFYSCKYKKTFMSVCDFIAPLCPPGLMAGRIGNFINQELWGRVSDLPWAVVFPLAGPLPRHPSQLYEGLLEGLVLFLLIWLYSSKKRSPGKVSGLFLLCYAVIRFLVEFVREPDAHLGYVLLDFITMGQMLSIPVALVGIWLFLRNEESVQSKV